MVKTKTKNYGSSQWLQLFWPLIIWTRTHHTKNMIQNSPKLEKQQYNIKVHLTPAPVSTIIFRHDFISLTTSSMVLIWRSFSLRGGSDNMLTMRRHSVTSLTPSGILAVAPRTRERMRRGLTPRSICACTQDMGPGTHTHNTAITNKPQPWKRHHKPTIPSWKVYCVLSQTGTFNQESSGLKAIMYKLFLGRTQKVQMYF